jgi:hypothetical protein
MTETVAKRWSHRSYLIADKRARAGTRFLLDMTHTSVRVRAVVRATYQQITVSAVAPRGHFEASNSPFPTSRYLC